MSRTLVAVVFVIACAGLAGVASAEQLYLVEGHANAGGNPVSPEQAVVLLEQMVIPSLEEMAKMEESGTIVAGGILSGTRAGVAIVRAESNEAVTGMLRKLPFWGVLDWKVTPLESYSFRAQADREALQHLKSRQ